MSRKRQSRFLYRITKIAAWFYAKTVFKRKMRRNEIKGKKGPFVIIANHQAALDFVNLIGASQRLMTFVVSDSFYNTLPVKGIMTKIKVIPKQQFQTTVTDLKKMKTAIEQGKILVIYPAGLMCEDGVSTPIPDATYKFLKWLGTDVYMARTQGTYFVSPKWSKIKRRGRTYLDIYKLFDKDELKTLSEGEVKERASEALLFDAYREQEELKVKYKNGSNIEGLENVLYICPHCKGEFTTRTQGNRIFCTVCGYEQSSDEYGFLHNEKGIGEEIRYVSDWSRWIYEAERERVKNGEIEMLKCDTVVEMIDYDKRKFLPVSEATLTLDKDKFTLKDKNESDEEVTVCVPIATFASLPFKPGKYIEIQKGPDIYRLLLENGKEAMRYVNVVKAFYELNSRLAKPRLRQEQ